MPGSLRAGFGIAVGALLIAYCVYFDYKRRKDPDYKRKVHERRNFENNKKSNAANKDNDIPKSQDSSQLERFFFQELRLSETFLANGNYESGVEHLANAILVYNQPFQILHHFQSTLPPHLFEMLIRKIQTLSLEDVKNATTSAGLTEENIAA